MPSVDLAFADVPRFIFREYDIRGRVDSELTPAVAEAVGYAFGCEVGKRTGDVSSPSVCLAHDGRVSSPDLGQAVMCGLQRAGIDVVFLGLGPTPFLYWAEHHLSVNAALMVTGSHNPPGDNGLKLTLGKRPFFGEQIQGLLTPASCPSHALGKREAIDLKEAYCQQLVDRFSWGERELKIIWDSGNGAYGPILRSVVDRLPFCSVIIHEKVDGLFPHRSPDPTKQGALEKLAERVRQEEAHVGFAFDGDGDRLVCVDENGTVWSGDELLLFFAEHLPRPLSKHTIIADIKSSPFLMESLRSQGANVQIEKTGHVHIKRALREHRASLGGEVSGHFFFQDAYLGFDDGLYAALRLVHILSRSSDTLSKWYGGLPRRFSSPEYRLFCPEEQKGRIIGLLKKKLAKEKTVFSDKDGLLVMGSDYWWLIRPSKTEAALVVRYEALTTEIFLFVRQKIRKELSLFSLKF